MVTKTDTTEIVTQPKLEEKTSHSLKRWFKHFFYMPASKRYFTREDQNAIAQAVQQAEQGHVGEIQVVVEGHIPCQQAYSQDTCLRARQLFAELGVWDTGYNSGVLLYLNLCERTVEIVIDRGIKQATEQHTWNEICQQITAGLKQQQYREAVVEGILSIGQVLNSFYVNQVIDDNNEIANRPIILN